MHYSVNMEEAQSMAQQASNGSGRTGNARFQSFNPHIHMSQTDIDSIVDRGGHPSDPEWYRNWGCH